MTVGPPVAQAAAAETPHSPEGRSLAGTSVKVRFAMANDAYVGDYGWFVDDISVYTCGS